MNTKTCSKCGIEKPLTDFYPHWSAVDGRSGFCKACAIEDDRKRRQRKQQQKESMQSKKPTKSKPATPPTNNGCEPLATPKTRAEKERWNLPATRYEPLNVLRDIGPGVTAARPGAFDHEQCGSLQADGSTHPYARAALIPCWRQPQALQPSATRGKFSKD